MDDLYRQNILEHARNPHNSGRLEQPTVSREEHNPLCGDRLRFDLQIRDGVLTDVRFSGRGCAVSQAAASMLSETLVGRSVDEVKAIGKQDVLELLGIPIGYTRLKCAMLGLKAVKAGVYGMGDQSYDDEELL